MDGAALQRVDLHEELENTLTLLHNRVKTRIDVVRECGRIPLIDCVSSQINQVFMNLLLNAIEAIPSRGTIRIKTASEPDMVKVSIVDTGKGISPEKLKSFFLSHHSRHEGRSGTQPAYLPEIIHDHGGEIRVESLPGQGSTFTVTLPVRLSPAL